MPQVLERWLTVKSTYSSRRGHLIQLPPPMLCGSHYLLKFTLQRDLTPLAFMNTPLILMCTPRPHLPHIHRDAYIYIYTHIKFRNKINKEKWFLSLGRHSQGDESNATFFMERDRLFHTEQCDPGQRSLPGSPKCI